MPQSKLTGQQVISDEIVAHLKLLQDRLLRSKNIRSHVEQRNSSSGEPFMVILAQNSQAYVVDVTIYNQHGTYILDYCFDPELVSSSELQMNNLVNHLRLVLDDQEIAFNDIRLHKTDFTFYRKTPVYTGVFKNYRLKGITAMLGRLNFKLPLEGPSTHSA